jgi:signal transduction histidine kinase
MFVYVIVAAVLAVRRDRRPGGLALTIGVGWFVATFVVDSLVQFGVIDFVVLNDFGFLGFVVAMGLQEARRSIETERVLLAYKEDLEGMVADRTSELEEAHAELLTQAEDRAVTEERNRLAQELHDAVTQLLFSINLIAGSLPELMRKNPEAAERTTRELQRLTRGALAEMRTLLRELRPHTIAVTDLATLVGQLTDGLAARHDIPTDVRLDFDDDLPPDVHLAVYRIAQEALNNVAKHANASSLVVELTGDDCHIHLSIADDGYGFDTAIVAPHRMGLDIMQERASSIGGEVAVASEPNKGTTVVMDWSDNSHG